MHFGPKEEDNFIRNIATGDKLPLRPNGKGSYLLEVDFVGGGKADIVVDSGAEESVCPFDWGRQFGIREADRWMKFRNASGEPINHYGHRDVLVESPF